MFTVFTLVDFSGRAALIDGARFILSCDIMAADVDSMPSVVAHAILYKAILATTCRDHGTATGYHVTAIADNGDALRMVATVSGESVEVSGIVESGESVRALPDAIAYSEGYAARGRWLNPCGSVCGDTELDRALGRLDAGNYEASYFAAGYR